MTLIIQILGTQSLLISLPLQLRSVSRGASLLLEEVGRLDGDVGLNLARHLEQLARAGLRVGEGDGLHDAGGRAIDVAE